MQGLSNFQKVKEFHKTYGQPVNVFPRFHGDRIPLRLALIDEEVGELKEACEAADIIEMADALGDIAYVVYGMALEMGIDLDAVIAEIHRSNMSKLGEDGKPIYAPNGKVVKGPNYFKPDLKTVLGL